MYVYLSLVNENGMALFYVFDSSVRAFGGVLTRDLNARPSQNQPWSGPGLRMHDFRNGN